MKHFMIRYRRKSGSEEQWHQDIAAFIAALDSDPAVKGRISYRCMRRRGETDYYHLASVADDAAAQALQSQPFFTRYNQRTREIGGGEVEVVPLEVVGETQFRG